jgi:hypothetical protein
MLGAQLSATPRIGAFFLLLYMSGPRTTMVTQRPNHWETHSHGTFFSAERN